MTVINTSNLLDRRHSEKTGNNYVYIQMSRTRAGAAATGRSLFSAIWWQWRASTPSGLVLRDRLRQGGEQVPGRAHGDWCSEFVKAQDGVTTKAAYLYRTANDTCDNARHRRAPLLVAIDGHQMVPVSNEEALAHGTGAAGGGSGKQMRLFNEEIRKK
jgi:hypothetical protein